MFKFKKRFGQNFLRNRSVINKIVSSIRPESTQLIEIGPGDGALSELILKKGIDLKMLEIDSECIAILEEKFSQRFSNFQIQHCDALSFDFAYTPIIGNLPYNISTKVIEKIVQNVVPYAIFMVQKEVAARLRGIAHGRLGIFVQSRYDVKKILNVNPDDFFPKPKVFSEVVMLIEHKKYPNLDLSKLENLTKTVFQFPRKQLNFLEKQAPEFATYLKSCGIKLEVRAENIPFEIFYQFLLNSI